MDVKDIKIVIGGRDKNERGANFEKLIVTVFDRLGYRDFRVKVKKTGHELDIKCKQKLTGYNATVECKAVREPIGTNQVKKARAQFDKDATKDKNLVCFVVSTGDFNGTALQWHDERIEDLEEAEKNKFQLIRKEKLLEWLKDAFGLESKRFFVLTDNFREIGSELTAYLAFVDMSPYFVAVSSENREKPQVMVVSTKAEPVTEVESRSVIEKIKDVIKIGDYELINLEVESEIIWFLLAGGAAIEEIAAGLKQSPTSVSNAVNRLLKEGLITEEGGTIKKYGLSKTLDSFTHITNLFIKDRPNAYMESSYFNLVLDNAVLKYAGDRYYVTFDEGDFETLIKISRTSNSALEFLLFGDTEAARNGYEQMNKPEVSADKRLIADRFRKNYIIQHAVFLLLTDIVLGKTIKLNWKSDNINFAFAKLNLAMGSQKDLFLRLASEHRVAIIVAGGDIKKGETVFYSGPSYELDIPFAIFLINAGETESGIKTLEKAASETEDPKGLFGIFTNLSLALNIALRFDEALEKNYEAEKYIDSAGENEDKAILYRNRVATLYKLFKRDGNLEYREKALEAWSKTLELNPLYPEPPELHELGAL